MCTAPAHLLGCPVHCPVQLPLKCLLPGVGLHKGALHLPELRRDIGCCVPCLQLQMRTAAASVVLHDPQSAPCA